MIGIEPDRICWQSVEGNEVDESIMSDIASPGGGFVSPMRRGAPLRFVPRLPGSSVALAIKVMVVVAVLCAMAVSRAGGAEASPVGTITLFQQGAATYAPYDVAAGPDGNMWFTKTVHHEVGRITPEGVITSFPVAHTGRGIAAGTDGNMWIALRSSIGRITMDGVASNFTAAGLSPWAIAPGPDGNMWFTNFSQGIGRITPSGVITLFSAPGFGNPQGIVAGSDGNMWFGDWTTGSWYSGITPGSNKIGRITMDGVVTTFTSPDVNASRDFALGPDGNVWFTNGQSWTIGRITTAGVVTVFGDPLIDTPNGIAPGPDGNMWFTSAGNSKVGRITMDGVVSMFGPTALSPAGIGAGPDGGMWFANVNTSNPAIGRVTAVLVPDAPSGAVGMAGDGRASVSWVAPPPNGSGPVTGYVVKASPGGQSCVWSSGPLGCTVTGLSNGVSYTFSVKASSAGGAGPASPPSAPVLVGSPNLFVTNGGTGVAIGRSVVPLADGGAVVAGQFQGDVSFGATVLTPAGGGFNGFVAKFSATGEALWARSIVSPNDVVPVGAAVDPASGDVSVTGTFSGTATLDGTAVVSAGGVDGLIARYSPTGALLWAHQFGGSGNDTATGVAGLMSGGVAVAANAGSAPTQFDETHAVTPVAISTGVVAAYSAAGDVSYVDPIGGQSISQISGVTAGADGTITATGWFIFNAQFGPGGPTLQSKYLDGWVARFPAGGGAAQWATKLGGSGALVQPRAVAVDGAGNAAISGGFSGGAVTLGTGGPVLGWNGADEAFVAAVTTTGQPIGAASARPTAGGTAALTVDAGPGGFAAALLLTGVNGFVNTNPVTGGSTGLNTMRVTLSADGTTTTHDWPAKASAGNGVITFATAVGADENRWATGVLAGTATFGLGGTGTAHSASPPAFYLTRT